MLELGFNQLTHVGLGYLTSTLTNYHAMRALHLDNNQLGDRGAELVATAIRTMSLELLDVGFNGISTTGVRPLMRALGCHSTIRSFTLSGNNLDTEGARAVASAITTNASLRELYLDHTSIGHAGERLICMGLESSPALHLHVLTGFRLGMTYTRMGFPPEMETLANEQVRLPFPRLPPPMLIPKNFETTVPPLYLTPPLLPADPDLPARPPAVPRPALHPPADPHRAHLQQRPPPHHPPHPRRRRNAPAHLPPPLRLPALQPHPTPRPRRPPAGVERDRQAPLRRGRALQPASVLLLAARRGDTAHAVDETAAAALPRG